jgi:hypothetical protein
MSNFHLLKKVTSILLSFCFLINCIVMPFCNFQDTVSTKMLYDSFLQKDRDGDVLEFIANDMLNMGGLFEDEDDDEPENKMPPQHPVQPIQITQGSLSCTKTIVLTEKETLVTPRVFGSFIPDTYKFKLPGSVFHPPAFIV